MPIDPDDIFGPDDELPSGPVIDVTPKPEKEEKEGIDFDSDKPIIEQILEKEPQGPDRTDQRPGCMEQMKVLILLFSAVIGGLICLIFYILF